MIMWNSAGGLYDPRTDSWDPATTTDAPTPRVEFTVVWTGSQLIVWGGGGNSDFTGDTTNTGAQYTR